MLGICARTLVFTLLKLRKGILTYVHGRPAVIVYTYFCTTIVLFTFRIYIAITIGLRHGFARPILYNLLDAQLTLVIKSKHTIVN